MKYSSAIAVLLITSTVLGSTLLGASPAVMLSREVETLGAATGVTVVQIPGASGGSALALAPTGEILWAARLPTGEYSLLLRSYAPAGDQDGFFVKIAGKRTRRTARIGAWGVLAYGFEVLRDGPVAISILGQEPGVVVDRAAIIGGRSRDNQWDPMDLETTGESVLVSLEDIPRVEQACRLATPPQLEGPDLPEALYAQNFDGPVRTGIHGNHAVGPGKWGHALLLQLPDGRFDVNITKTPLGPEGTVSWWVRPRPAIEAWRDQGWRYFLHLSGAAGQHVRMDLSRHVSTGLLLSVGTARQPLADAISVRTRSLDFDEWHHLLVSWDFSGEKQSMWLLVDGEGVHLRMPEIIPADSRFTHVMFGNTPPDDDLPFLPMDGAVDHIRITGESVRGRLAQ